jgi:hypothetical protein
MKQHVALSRINTPCYSVHKNAVVGNSGFKIYNFFIEMKLTSHFKLKCTIRVTRRLEKNCPIFQKVATTVAKPKKAKISTSMHQLERTNHLH